MRAILKHPQTPRSQGLLGKSIQMFGLFQAFVAHRGLLERESDVPANLQDRKGFLPRDVEILILIRCLIISHRMIGMLERKHLALLEEAERRAVAPAVNVRACFELLALAGAIDRDCARRLAPHRLSEGKFTLLFLLHDKPDGLSPHELAERAGVTRATITGLLDGLERDGFIVRRGGLDDRRKIAVALTDSGQTTARDLVNQHVDWVASLFEGFTTDERETLNILLQRVWRNLDSRG